MKKIHKALTFRASSIGDCLMGKHLLENIYAQHPNARLGIVVASRGAMIRDLFAAYPWLEVLEVNRRSPRALWRLWRDWHGSDLVTTQVAGKNGGAFGLASKFAARLLARRGCLIGFCDTSLRWNSLLYDKLLPVRSNVSVIEYERDVLRAAGSLIPFNKPTFVCLSHGATLDRLHLVASQYVVVHMFSGNDGRGINPENRRELLKELRANLSKDITLVVSGGPADRVGAETAASNIANTMVIAGQVPLQELSNIIVGSRGVISLDTGVGHLAAHLHKPLIILRTCMGAPWWVPSQYGADIPKAQFERDELCANGHRTKNFPDCLNEIDMVHVAETAKILFE